MIGRNINESLGRFVWLFSDTEFNKGKHDVHFVLDTATGKVHKICEQRTKYVPRKNNPDLSDEILIDNFNKKTNGDKK